jgi:hypothetical protein
MVGKFLERTVEVREVWLDKYDGDMIDVLRALLSECGCDLRVRAMKYAYYGGTVKAISRVCIQLPAKLGMSVVMPSGEAHNIREAYYIAVFRAITEIREHKTKELIGTEFSHIPQSEEESDPPLNHYKLAKKHPDLAAMDVGARPTMPCSTASMNGDRPRCGSLPPDDDEHPMVKLFSAGGNCKTATKSRSRVSKKFKKLPVAHPD